MKQRLLVMNGQKLLQENERGSDWVTVNVGKAGAVKPAIYPIHLAEPADKSKSHDGVVLHADKESVYQQVGKGFVKHARDSFDKVPEIGSNLSIKYDGDKAKTAPSSVKLGRGLSR